MTPRLAAMIRARTGQSPATAVDLNRPTPVAPPPRNQATPRAIGRLAALIQTTQAEANPMAHAEANRIVRLPIMQPITKEEALEVSRDHLLAPAYRDGFRLHAPQAAAIVTYKNLGGLFAPIGVGWGKTLVTVAIADMAFKKGIPRILLLLPSAVYLQFRDVDMKMLRRKIPVGVPFHWLGHRTAAMRMRVAHSRLKGCYVLPYSCLSVKNTEDLLQAIAPGSIIADEVHKLANRRSARTRRLFKLIVNQDPTPEFSGLSGTITNKTVKEYHHLIRVALREYSPLPIPAQMAADWGNVIDSSAEEMSDNPKALTPMRPLLNWARRNFPGEDLPLSLEGLRGSYRLRLNHCPGVVCTGDEEIGTSIVINNTPIKGYKEVEGWTRLKTLIDQLNNMWLTPNGDEVEHAIHKYKWGYELSSGFYNELIWHTPEERAETKKITVDQARSDLERANVHHILHQEYSRQLRRWLQDHHIKGLDTPMLVGGAFANGKRLTQGSELQAAWVAMKAAWFEGIPERYSRFVRVCPWKVNAAVEWAKAIDKTGQGALMWVYNKGMGVWLHEALLAAGIDALHAPAGDDGDRLVRNVLNGKKFVVASLTSHGEGKNLQHYGPTAYVQWPRSAKLAEQSLGRNHRNGQLRDCLTYSLFLTSEFDRMLFSATLVDTCYVSQTTGLRQKLMIATHIPAPVVVEDLVLREMGLQNRVLTKVQQRIFAEKFSVVSAA